MLPTKGVPLLVPVKAGAVSIAIVLSPKDVGILLGLGTRTARELMSSGAIESFRCHGKLWRTKRSDLARYMDAATALERERRKERELSL